VRIRSQGQRAPYTQYLSTDSLKGKRFGVPVCVMQGLGIPFQGIPASATPAEVKEQTKAALLPL
jgi:amidase/aspartyl-tRNA(Asn)/glutamyl-tRNA(Gln) amidotransferase subunit A